MCGIAAIININASPTSNLKESIQHILSQLGHRGPEKISIKATGLWALGITRLAIVDLNNQNNVFSTQNDSVHIVVNGEIFNYPELRKKLTARGYSFRSSCDSEVIGPLYQEYGLDFLNMLNGQYAIIIHDTKNNRTVLARDRFGIVPLFYCYQNGVLYVSSEIKGFQNISEISKEFNLQALDQVFTFWTTIGESTFIKSIKSVRHSHYLIFSESDTIERRYYDISLTSDIIQHDLKFETAKLSLQDKLRESINLRLQLADVEVGTYLSGGLDSSIITKVSNQIKHELKTFSIDFDDQLYAENEFQDAFKKECHLKNTRVIINHADIVNSFEQAVFHAEQPIFRSAPVPLFRLSEQVHKEGIKVVLTGEGADEVFWGYDLFKENNIRRFWRKNPDSAIRPLLLQKLYQQYPHFDAKYFMFISSFYKESLLSQDTDFFSHIVRWNNSKSLKSLFSAQTKESLGGYDAIESLRRLLPKNFASFTANGKAQYLEMMTLLPGYLLSSQGDRMAMAHSVEMRIPFLDHNVVEFAAVLPEKYKVNGLKDKYILREAYKEILPASIYKRPKFAYQAPEMQAFIKFSKNSYIEHLFSEELVQKCGIFDYKFVERLYKKLLSGKSEGRFSTRDNMAFVQILSTHIFYSQYIEK